MDVCGGVDDDLGRRERIRRREMAMYLYPPFAGGWELTIGTVN